MGDALKRVSLVFLLLISRYSAQNAPVEVQANRDMTGASLEPTSDSAHVLSVIDDAMDQLDKLRENHFIDSDGKDLPLEHFDITFDHVNFGYDSRQVLHDVSFTIPEHTSTAVDDGCIVEKGTHAQLIAQPGRYQQFVRIREKAEGWKL